jgi:putative nucleotidyltransferase with HDIG domain
MEQQMRENINKQESIYEPILWLFLALGVVFWLVDSILMLISSTNVSFLQTLTGIGTQNIWQRLIVLCFFVVFASHIKYTENKQLEADEKLQKTLDSLRSAFGTTIKVMVSAIEMRDPYTAGHLKKSADIARAIAVEMGLDKENINGIRMAGIIHDIGKISIPTEILTRPSKLSKLEFSLIRKHSQSGYDMLKDIESPWPLAEIVYQHHERMDGTGYPRNLKGDDILPEARILAVADVVEAMASHRPYRAALGIDKALEEIEKNKGILYDEAVADACLRLFREKGYQIA